MCRSRFDMLHSPDLNAWKTSQQFSLKLPSPRAGIQSSPPPDWRLCWTFNRPGPSCEHLHYFILRTDIFTLSTSLMKCPEATMWQRLSVMSSCLLHSARAHSFPLTTWIFKTAQQHISGGLRGVNGALVWDYFNGGLIHIWWVIWWQIFTHDDWLCGFLLTKLPDRKTVIWFTLHSVQRCA